ncbi:hypothetical protein PsorP6_000749 [Peronosclerospora sorghi]|uniref:Uncharacterized protein n=1 Tax=Peronosclerospora sorghi TaxID=230839 RepID=A0ACC0WW32_9STRA|nr:hypothetical protein PsorP6_000749 [Peronosclerospora sorghi]
MPSSSARAYLRPIATLDVSTLHSRVSATNTFSSSSAKSSKTELLLSDLDGRKQRRKKHDAALFVPPRVEKLCSKIAVSSRPMPKEGSMSDGTNFSSLTIFSTTLIATISRSSLNSLSSHSGPRVASPLAVNSSSKACARTTSSFNESSASRITATSALKVRPILPLFGSISTFWCFSGLSNLCVPTISIMLFFACTDKS